MFADMSTGVPQIQSDKLRALGVTAAKRSPLLPQVPNTATPDETRVCLKDGFDPSDLYELVHSGGVMRRCSTSNTCPKFFLGLSGTEFWQLQGPPVLTDAFGFRDLTQPDHARIYYYASTQHGSADGDTRPSLESLYGNQAGYVSAVTTAAHALVTERFLLQLDANRLIQRAIDNPVLP